MSNPFNPFIPLLMYIRRILGKDKPTNDVASSVKADAPVEIKVEAEAPVQIQEEIKFEFKEQEPIVVKAEAPVQIHIQEEIKLEVKEAPVEVTVKPSKKEKSVIKKPQAKSSVVSKSGRNPKFKK